MNHASTEDDRIFREKLISRDLLLKQAQHFCSEHEFPPQIASSLFLAESDWMFFVQASAILETALNQSICNNIAINGHRSPSERFSKFIENLPLNGRASKVSFAKAANLIVDETENFIIKISEIRNFYAHNMANYSMTLADYIYKRKKNDQAGYLKVFKFPSDVQEVEFQKYGGEIRAVIAQQLIMHLNMIKLFS